MIIIISYIIYLRTSSVGGRPSTLDDVVVVLYEVRNQSANAPPTAHPRVMEAIDALFERVKPLFDPVSVGVVHATAQP
jgi:hypothetical protein